jgi:hypothetical protein
MALATFLTGDLLRECALSSRTSAVDQERRLGRLARLFAISHLLRFAFARTVQRTLMS